MPVRSLLVAAVVFASLASAAARADIYACTEQGFLLALAHGGGPHTFDCVGETEIAVDLQQPVIDEYIFQSSVVLDGEGRVTISHASSLRLSLRDNASTTPIDVEFRNMKFRNVTFFPWGTGGPGSLTLDHIELTQPSSGSGLIQRCDGGTVTVRVLDSWIRGREGPFPSRGSGLTVCNGEVRGTTLSGFTGEALFAPLVLGWAFELFPTAYDHQVLVENVTLADNDVRFGVLHVGAGTQATLRNLTIADNTSELYPVDSPITVGYCEYRMFLPPSCAPPDAVFVSNSILEDVACFHGSQASRRFDDDPEPPLIPWAFDDVYTRGGNVSTFGDLCDLDGADDLPLALATSEAVFPLGGNGGPTLTNHPAPGSAAIGAGVIEECPAFDQRGVPRDDPLTCASGAVEFLPEPAVLPALAMGWLSGLLLARQRRRARGRGSRARS